MKPALEIPTASDPALALALDTLARHKQALVFVNTKRGAESQAEKIAGRLKPGGPHLEELSREVLGALSRPTKQCQRLAACVKKGVAFHHAGVAARQRDLIEDAFRQGRIGIICATPTLAQGVDLPAFRTILRDLKRYGARGLAPIPVLEYEQQAGRAGRPGKEEYGEAIAVAQSEGERDAIYERYICGVPEEIQSKLAVEPVLRTYILSLIASEFVASRPQLLAFFDRTFYAQQFRDLAGLHRIMTKMLRLLAEWEFIVADDDGQFKSAGELGREKLAATTVGRRVSELYLDPFDAQYLIECLRRGSAASQARSDFSYLVLICRTLEMRPYLHVKMAEFEDIAAAGARYQDVIFEPEPGEFSEEYERYLDGLKTALCLRDWIEEHDEDYLLATYGIRPGELNAKLEVADWLVFSSQELCRLLHLNAHRNELAKLRLRLKHGAKEELLPLLQLRNIGRVRSRALFARGVRTIADVKAADLAALARSLGSKAIALDIKDQVGQKMAPEDVEVKPNKRKGQISLKDWET